MALILPKLVKFYTGSLNKAKYYTVTESGSSIPDMFQENSKQRFNKIYNICVIEYYSIICVTER